MQQLNLTTALVKLFSYCILGFLIKFPSRNFFFFLIFEFNFIYFFIQQVLISHQFYTHQCIHVSPNRPIHHTTIPITPRLFPPLVSICWFSTSVSQLLPCKPVHLYHFSRFHIYVLIYDICFSLSDLTSLCVTVSRSIHVSTNDPISFLFMAE